MDQSSEFRSRCLSFSAGIISLISKLPRNRVTGNIIEQLGSSGTSIGANVHEAKGAESRADFIHKMQIALKEARETDYWLSLIKMAGLSSGPLLDQLCQEAVEIAAILAKSVITAKANGQIKK